MARVAVSPEEIGLVGCWQVIAVKRDRIPRNPAKTPGQPEVGYYVSSIALEALSDEEISQLIRDHQGGFICIWVGGRIGRVSGRLQHLRCVGVPDELGGALFRRLTRSSLRVLPSFC